MYSIKIIIGLNNKGALKRGFGVLAVIIVIFASVMAHYALSDVSETSIYDKVNAGDYIDTGLDRTKGISMDLVEKGLTHKVLEFEITSEISSQDIQLLIAENNFDAKEGSLAKAEAAQREYPVYETVCSPYSLPEEANGSIVKVENCTMVQKGIRAVESEEWLPVNMKSAEENADSSLATFNILEKGRYRYSFNTPIVQTPAGWGNKGTVFLKTEDGLFADKQHSSDWYDNANARKMLNITNVLGTLNLTLQDLVLNLSGFDANKIVFVNADDNTTAYKWVNFTAINATTHLWLSLPNLSNGITYIYIYNADTIQPIYYIDDLEAKIFSDGGEYQAISTGLANKSWVKLSGDISRSIYSDSQPQHGNTSILSKGIGVEQRIYQDLGSSIKNISVCWHFLKNTSFFNQEIWGAIADSADTSPDAYFYFHQSTAAFNRIVVQGDGINIYNITNLSGYIPTDMAYHKFCIEQGCWNEGNCSKNRYSFNDQILDYNNYPTQGIRYIFTSTSSGYSTKWDNFFVTKWYGVDQPAYTLGGLEPSNYPPTTPSPIFSPATAYTNTDLNCSSYINDSDGDNMEVFFNLTVNGELKANHTLFNQPNGSQPLWIINSGNYTKGQNVSCWIRLFDGKEYSESNYTSIVISNAAPEVISYNASNATHTDTLSNVNFSEGENITFAVAVSDADVAEGADTLWYSWFVDNVIDPMFQSSWFDWAFNFTSSGLHIVRVDVNDSSNAIINQTWNVNIANVVNKQWSVDYVTPPTPSDKENLTSQAVNISVLVSPTLKAAALKIMFHASSSFTGNLSSTMLNTSDNSLQLAYPALAGAYTSPVYEFESNVTWGNMSWVDLLSEDGGFETQNGLTGLWHMNQETSPVLDYSGNGNDGTCSGANCPALATGKRGKAYKFDGINDKITAANSSSLQATNKLTVSAWFKMDSPIHYGCIVGKTPDSNWNKGWGMYWANNNNLYFWINGYSTNIVYLPFSDTSSWHHVTGTYNGSMIGLYLDGAYAQNNYVGTIDPSGNLEIGGDCAAGGAYFNGSIDEVMVWNRSLSPEEVLDSYNSLMANVTFQMRGCNDDGCVGEEFVGPSGASSYYTNAEYESLGNLQPNKWFQYKALLNAPVADFTPKLYNVTFKGVASSYYEDVTISKAWIEWNGVNKEMSGSGLSWSYANSTLDKGGYTYRVYVNDSFGNVNVTETRTFSVPSYTIYFNITNADNGAAMDNVNKITCDYSGFSKGSDTTNPYGPYTFPVGTWNCLFEENEFFNKTHQFIANADKTEDVTMSVSAYLTREEHDWLGALYNCVISGNCDAYNYWSGTYKNVSRIWNEFIPTNISVVANETFVSKTLSSTSNITIDYNVNVPYKKGVEDKALLPIRIFYWFTNTSGVCYNQDKQADSNTAETPFCIPLMAEYLGPNNGSVNFRVELDPTLPDGTYEVVRQIDIDPPVNGLQTWINYGRENIGSIKVLNPIGVGTNTETDSKSTSTIKAEPLLSPNLNPITGASTTNSDSNVGYNGWFVSLWLVIISVTIISSIYIRSRYK